MKDEINADSNEGFMSRWSKRKSNLKHDNTEIDLTEMIAAINSTRVYEVAEVSALQLGKQLSSKLDNNIYLSGRQ